MSLAEPLKVMESHTEQPAMLETSRAGSHRGGGAAVSQDQITFCALEGRVPFCNHAPRALIHGILLLFLAAGLGLPCRGQGGFTSVDIGKPAPAGRTVALTNGYDVTSSTGDVWGYFDNFRFVYKPVDGNFDFRVRMQGLSGASFWTKGGIMIRTGLADYSQNAFMIATRTAGWGRYFMTSRPGDFYPSFSYYQGSFDRVSYPDAYLRLVRIGNNIIAQHSADGVDWTQIGNLDFAFWPRAAYVGVAVSNHPDSGTAPATAQFRDMELTLRLPKAPAILTQPESRTANPGNEVTLNVLGAGGAVLSHQWFKDGDPLAGATNATLVVNTSERGSDGKYTCKLANDFGTVWSWSSQLEVTPSHEPWNGILGEVYNRVYGGQIAYMINATNYPTAPVSRLKLPRFEISGSSADTGGRIRGFVSPPATGNYIFYIAADERGELRLSADDNPAGKRVIAECYYYVGAREWDYYEEQISAPVRLEAGRRYFLEAFFKGDGAPNQCAVVWRLPNGSLEGPIPSSRFVGSQATLSGSLDATDRFTLRLNGTTNSAYVVESSSDLASWTPIVTNRAPFLYEDSMPSGVPSRFYRAVIGP